MKKTVVRKYVLFTGRVQGVGFRYYTVQKARQLGLTGWVKNLVDGTVAMEAQGEETQIEELIAFLRSQRYIQITHISVKDIPLRTEHSFRVKGY